jgi:hypothetical protein
MPTAGPAKGSFTGSAMFVAKNDQGVPAVTYDGTRPGVWRQSKFLLNRLVTGLKNLTLDTGVTTQYPADPNQVEGFTAPQTTDRKMAGSMDPYATLVATRNIFADFRAGVVAIIHALLQGGNAANPGQRIAFTVPQAFHIGYQPGTDGKLATEEVNFFPRGQDAGFFICIY